MKIHPVGADMFHAQTDRQTDMTKLIVAFSNFANSPMKYLECKKRRTILKFTNLKTCSI